MMIVFKYDISSAYQKNVWVRYNKGHKGILAIFVGKCSSVPTNWIKNLAMTALFLTTNFCVVQYHIYFLKENQILYCQSHYREVAWWEIFMQQELRFGLDLGQLALLKKNIWGDYEQQLFRLVFFQVLLGKKKIIYTYISGVSPSLVSRWREG